MELSCCIWALSEPETVAHQQLKDLGFTAFDIRPSLLRSDEANASRKSLGFDLCCIALTHERPEGAKIDNLCQIAHNVQNKNQFSHPAPALVCASQT